MLLRNSICTYQIIGNAGKEVGIVSYEAANNEKTVTAGRQ